MGDITKDTSEIIIDAGSGDELETELKSLKKAKRLPKEVVVRIRQSEGSGWSARDPLGIASRSVRNRWSAGRRESYGVFESCGINRVIIPAPMASIGDRCFMDCGDLTEVTFPDSVEKIGYRAFSGCWLQHLDLPASLEWIGMEAFYCNRMESVSIPDNVKYIGGGAFAGCIYLGHISLPAGIKHIGAGAFEGCLSLEDVEIGGVKKPLESRPFVILRENDSSTLHYLGLYRDLCLLIVPDGSTKDHIWDELEDSLLDHPQTGQALPPTLFALLDTTDKPNVFSVQLHICEYSQIFKDSALDSRRDSILEEWPEEDFDRAEEIFKDDPESALMFLLAGCKRFREKRGDLAEKIADLLVRNPSLVQYKEQILEQVDEVPVIAAFEKMDFAAKERESALEDIINAQKEIIGLKNQLEQAIVKKNSLLESFNGDVMEEIVRFLKETRPRLKDLPEFRIPTDIISSRTERKYNYDGDIEEEVEVPFVLFKKAVAIREGEISHKPIIRWETGPQRGLSAEDADHEEYFSDLSINLRVELFRHMWSAECPAFIRQFLPDYDNLERFEEALQSLKRDGEILSSFPIYDTDYRLYKKDSMEKGQVILENIPEDGSFSIPEGVKEIGSGTLKQFIEWPEKVRHLILPAGLERIEMWAFSGCSSLETVTIPEGVVSIRERAFEGCNALKSLHLPASLTEIGENLFGDWGPGAALESITVAEGNPVFDSRNECNALIQTADGKLLLGCSTSTIPDGVAIIGYCAFKDSKIQKVILPPSVKGIGPSAFEGCDFLSELTLDDGLEWIGSGAFDSCFRLEEVKFNDGLEMIGSEAFRCCSRLRNITIPSSIKEPLPYATFEKATQTRDQKWYGAAFHRCYNIKYISIPRKLSFVRTRALRPDSLKHSSKKGLLQQIGLIDYDFIPKGYAECLGWDSRAYLEFKPEVDVVIRRMDIPKTTSILLDLAYDGYHMICKVSIALLESVSHYEYENGQYGSCRLDDPFQEHLAGVYLSDHPEVKSWKPCKSLDDGIKFELYKYKEELSPVLADARKIELQDLWP